MEKEEECAGGKGKRKTWGWWYKERMAHIGEKKARKGKKWGCKRKKRMVSV